MNTEQLELEERKLESQYGIVMAKVIAAPDKSKEQKELIAEQEQITKRVIEVRQEIYDLKFDPEIRERRELEDGASIVAYLDAAVRNEKLHGAEAELSEEVFGRPDARGESGGVLIPFEALATPRIQAAGETNITTDGAANQNDVLPRIFARSACAFMGCRFDSVAPGVATHIVLTAGNTPAIKAKGASHAQTAATVATTELKPSRLTSRLVYRVEDAARIPGFAMALNRDIVNAISDRLDHEVINHSSKGLIGDLANPTNPTDETTFGKYSEIWGGEVDGLYAHSPADIAILVPSGVYGHMSGQFANSGKGDVSAADYARQNYSIMVSGNMPAVASNIGTVLVHKKASMSVDHVAAIWQGIEVIRDPYTEAASGEVALTGIMLMDFAILREDAYSRLEVKTG